MNASLEQGTRVRVFSRVQINYFLERTIALLHSPGDRPAVAVALFEGSERRTQTLFRGPDELAPLSRAISIARDLTHPRRVDVGGVNHRTCQLLIWAVKRRGLPPAVVFARSTFDGERIGKPTTISGAELVALEAAVNEARRLTEIG